MLQTFTEAEKIYWYYFVRRTQSLIIKKSNRLRILTVKKQPQIKYGHLCRWYIKSKK